MKVNQLIQHYHMSNITLGNIYEIKIKCGAIDENATTFKKHCGFLVPLSGKALYKFGDTPYYLEYGTILHAGPNMQLNKYVGTEEDWHYYLVHYDIRDMNESKDFIEQLHFTVMMNEGLSSQLIECCRQMFYYYRQSNPNHDIHMKALLYKMIALITDAKRENHLMTEFQKINYIKEYIANHLAETLSISQLASLVDMSLKRFTYIFTKIVGVSPKKYMNQIKVRKAEELLLSTDKSLVEIAMDVGYDDVFYFSRFFKKHTSYAPSDFKRALGKSPC